MVEGDFVRLYMFAADRLTAVVANTQSVRLLTYSTDGALLDDRWLLEKAGDDIAPRLVAVDRLEDGQYLLSLGTSSSFHIVPFDADSVIFEDEARELFAEVDLEADFAAVGFDASNPDQSIVGMIILEGGIKGVLGNAVFDNVVVSSGGVVVYEEDFSTIPPDWQLASETDIDHGVLKGFLSNPNSKEDSSWHNFRIDVDVCIGTWAEIIIGSQQSASFSLILNPRDQKGTIRWRFNTGSNIISTRVEEDLDLVSDLPYRVSMEVVDGQVRAWIRPPRIMWSTAVGEETSWAAMARLGEQLVLSLDEQGRVFDLQAQGLSGQEVLHTVEISEVRLRDNGSRVDGAFCFPRDHQVQVARGGLQSDMENIWPAIRVNSLDRLSRVPGSANGSFLFPLSSAFGPDGRLYVLDAGNDRIQVFSNRNQYLIQWGGAGSQAGEFNFERDALLQPESYTGSIIVDAEGFIYVADVMNGRIQKFSP